MTCELNAWLLPERASSWYRAGGGGNAPPTPPGITSTVPAVSCVVRNRLKSMMVWGSTWYLVPRLSNVSLAFVVTTMPGIGGMISWSPVATESGEIRFVFDRRLSVHGAQPGGQRGGKLAIQRRIARNRDRHCEHDGMRQISMNSQFLPLKSAN